MTNAAERAKELRNKDNYLKAKAAFNARDLPGCMSFYALNHQIRSRELQAGREQIEAFLSAMHAQWKNLQINVDHAVAEGDWVSGRCTSTAIHAQAVLGVPPTGRELRAQFWDMHRFDDDGLIVETWNVMDSLAIMQQLGLIPGGG